MVDDRQTDERAARVFSLIDVSRHSLAALSAAVNLASHRRLELVGLFVEDSDLLACAGFPFAREVGGHSGYTHPFSPQGLQAGLDRHARLAAQALEKAVAGRELRHHLQVSRGGVAREALALVGVGDVLVLGKAGLSGHWGVRLGSTSRALVLESPCPVIIWDERWPLHSGPLHFLGQLPGDSEALLERFQGLIASVELLPEMSADELAWFLTRTRSGALMLPRAVLLALNEEDPDLLARLPVPIFVVP